MRLLEKLPQGPMRDLIWSTLINTLGNGLSVTASTLYAVRVVGVSNRQLGTGLAAAALVALIVGLGLGHAADRFGSRRVLLALVAGQGGLCFVYAFTRSYWLFLFVITGLAIGNQGSANVRGALIAQITDPATRIRERAFLRSVTNFGVGAGSLIAGIAITMDTPTAYSTIIIVDGLSFFGAMYFIAKLPQVTRSADSDSDPVRATAALRNLPFVTAAGLTGVLCMHYNLLTLAVPLWVVQQTAAPRWVVAAAFALNTLMCVLFQVRASGGTETAQSSARVVRGSTFLIGGACLIYWLAHGRSSWVAAVLILLGALVHVIGELRQSTGAWGMGYALTPGEAHGQYQAVWQSSFTVGSLIAPPLMAGFVVTHGLLGWSTLAVIFIAAGLAMPIVTRYAVAKLPSVAGH